MTDKKVLTEEDLTKVDGGSWQRWEDCPTPKEEPGHVWCPACGADLAYTGGNESKWTFSCTGCRADYVKRKSDYAWFRVFDL